MMNSQDNSQRANKRRLSFGGIAFLLLGAAALGCVYGGGRTSQANEGSMEVRPHLQSARQLGVDDHFEATCRLTNDTVLWKNKISPLKFSYIFYNPNGSELYPEIPGASPSCTTQLCVSLPFILEDGETVEFEAPDADLRMVYNCGVDGTEVCLESLEAIGEPADCLP